MVLLSSFQVLGGVASVAKSLPSLAAASATAIWNPVDGDAVAVVGELTAAMAVKQMRNTMMADRTGRMILRNQPRVTDEVLERASRQPPGTFGHLYSRYMTRNNFLPSGRPSVTKIDDPTSAYVMQRYRECHDFVHSCTGFGRTVEDELAVKLFEWYHTGLPLGLLAVLGGMPWLNAQQARNMSLYNEWAALNAPDERHGGRGIPCLLNVHWEAYIERPFEDLINDTRITPIDVFLKQRGKSRGEEEKGDQK